MLVSNLHMTSEKVLHSLVQFEAHEMWPYATSKFQGKEKRSSIKIKLAMNVWKTCYIEMCGHSL
jgi:hypothetical protein